MPNIYESDFIQKPTTRVSNDTPRDKLVGYLLDETITLDVSDLDQTSINELDTLVKLRNSTAKVKCKFYSFVNNDTPEDKLRLCLSRSDFTLDVTHLDLNKLKGKIDSNLYSREADTFTLNHVTQSANIVVPLAKHIKAPLLEVSRDIVGKSLLEFVFEKLELGAHLIAGENNRKFITPNLRRAKTVDIGRCDHLINVVDQSENVNIGELRKTDDFIAPVLDRLFAPNLRRVRDMHAPLIKEACLDGLSIARRMTLLMINTLNFPKLRFCEEILATGAETRFTPLLDNADLTKIDAPRAKSEKTAPLQPNRVERFMPRNRRAAAMPAPAPAA